MNNGDDYYRLIELTEAGHRNPYRISRSHRKKKESYDYNFDYDTAEQQPSHGGEEEFHQTEYHHTDAPSSKPGYSDGSGLRSIAQGSADQANSAVANQHLAAKQASYIAQNNLANLALQASATAMAALQGKQVLLAKIEQENLDAHQQLEVELQQLRQAKRSAKAAQQVRPNYLITQLRNLTHNLSHFSFSLRQQLRRLIIYRCFKRRSSNLSFNLIQSVNYLKLFQ